MKISLVGLAQLIFIAFSATAAMSNVEMHMVPVLSQPLGRGEVIRDESVTMQEMKRSPAGIDYITDINGLVGLAAKRPLRAGVPLRITDLTKPKVILKGDMVNISFVAPGLSLAVRGKALDDGVLGHTLRVINMQTNRTFEGVAVAPGHVSVTTPSAPAIVEAPAHARTSRLEYSSSTALLGQ